MADDPYAAPALEVMDEPADAPECFGWRVEGKAVWVREVAQFPMVDPFCGKSGEVMSLRRVVVRYDPAWLWWIAFGGGAVGILAGWMLLGRDGDFMDFAVFFALGGLALGGVVARVVAGFFPGCVLRLFFLSGLLRARAALGRVVRWGLWLLLGCWLYLFQLPPWMVPVVAAGGLVWVAALFAHIAVGGRLRCGKRADGWWEVRGFHKRALERLAAEPECRVSMSPRGKVEFLR